MRRLAAIKRPKRKRDDAALVHRLGAALPRPSAQAAARVAAWLASVRPKSAGKSLMMLIRRDPAAAQLLGGIAEAAPYLWDAIDADPARLTRLLLADPNRTLAALLEKTHIAGASARSQAELMRILRDMKAEAALLIALADIAGVWELAFITGALTRVADTAVDLAVNHLIREAVKHRKLKAPVRKNPQSSSGYIVLAMGKMGAGELNFSSDIDLMVFFDASAAKLGRDVEPAPFFIGLSRDLVKILQARTPEGYVFRVDLRLRPDPSSTQIAISTEAARHYYESRGQNWERAALIKARVCAGDNAAGERFLRDLSPFIWRKYLDYAAIAHVHDMKRQIHAYRGHGEIAIEGHNIKLGRGGIREIEFFVQTQQLIAGGRHPDLRDRGTIATLSALAADGWIDTAARDELAAAYQFLRSLEHRLQMVADEQTHTLPGDQEGLERFARFFGFANRDALAEVLLKHLRNVQRHYATLFESAAAAEARERALTFPPEGDDRETLDKLTAMGFRQPLEVSALVRDWLAGSHRSLKGSFARAELARIVPLLLPHFAQS